MEAMEEAPVAQEQQEQMEVAAAEGEAGGPIPLSALQVGFAEGARGRRRSPLGFFFRGALPPAATEHRGCPAVGAPASPRVAPRPLPLPAYP
jgi:hypothetical protein